MLQREDAVLRVEISTLKRYRRKELNNHQSVMSSAFLNGRFLHECGKPAVNLAQQSLQSYANDAKDTCGIARTRISITAPGDVTTLC